MNILMLGRPGLYDSLGGDRIQIEQSAVELIKLGHKVTIQTGRYFDPSTYDLVHVFQLDWNLDCYFQIKKAKDANKPVVFSPIHHNINELKKFDDEYVFDFRRVSKVLFKNQFHRDLFKELYRSFFNKNRMWPLFYASVYGLKNLYIQALKLTDIVLVQTHLEFDDLKKNFGVDLKWEIIQNGVGEHFLNIPESQSPLGIEDYIINIGRIEPRKNQLNIIQAVKFLRAETQNDFQLVIVGAKPSIKHFEYGLLFNKEVSKNSWVHYYNGISNLEVPKYYQHAKVGVSASWFETTGLTSLEALFCGTNAVASGDRAKEFLGNKVSFCEPNDQVSIKEAIKTEYYRPRPILEDSFKQKFTWKEVGRKLEEIYLKLI